MDSDRLRDLIDDDELGLLKIKLSQSNELTEDERLAESFFEICAFFEENGREPENDPSDVQQAKLAMRLEGLRKSPEKIKALIDLDEYGLLVPSKSVESIDDILADDDLNLLEGKDDDSIYNLRHVPKAIEAPDFIALRKRCDDFSQFEPLFLQCQAELRSGKRSIQPFYSETRIEKGKFYVHRGVMLYIDAVGDTKKQRGRKDARLRCIFENGTESSMLLLSLARRLREDGRCISMNEDRLMDDLKNISDEDSQTGYIYVLKSLSTQPDIASIEDLYKIGFSTVPVEERIKNTEDDPTYLMAPVRIVESFECFNLNPQKLELLLHRFFGGVCLEVDVFDKRGRRHTPREWFIVPLPIIEEAVELMISGEIINCAYDDEAKLIRGK